MKTISVTTQNRKRRMLQLTVPSSAVLDPRSIDRLYVLYLDRKMFYTRIPFALRYFSASHHLSRATSREINMQNTMQGQRGFTLPATLTSRCSHDITAKKAVGSRSCSSLRRLGRSGGDVSKCGDLEHCCRGWAFTSSLRVLDTR